MNETYTIPAGGTQLLVPNVIQADSDVEGQENFTALISSPSINAVILEPVTTVTVTDNNGNVNIGVCFSKNTAYLIKLLSGIIILVYIA